MTCYTARRTPGDLAGSGWYELLPPPGPAEELEGAITADWVVVGAGFAGLAAARRLNQLRKGDRIVVLDAQRVAWGAAGRNSGFMIDLPHELNSDSYTGASDEDLKQIRMNRAALRFVHAAVEEYGLQAFYSPSGKTHGATLGKGVKLLDAFERHLEALGEPYTRLDADDMRRLTGTGFYVRGTFTPGAAMIQPAGFIRGLADGLRANMTIYENSPVIRIEAGNCHAVHTPKGRIDTPNVILANNGHLESLGFYARRLMHVFTYASMTHELSATDQRSLGGEPEWSLIPADPMGSTLRRVKNGRILIRNTFTYNPDMETSSEEISRVGRRHDRSFRARFPMLKHVGMQYRWGGHLCLSLNSVPAFGEIGKGMYSACCCNGLGTVKGTLNGMLIADLAAGSNEPLVKEMLAFEPPRRLYPEPFMSLAARAHLWWVHMRAGAEL